MKKRLSLLLAALFVASTLAAAPVVAADANRDARGQERVCLKHKTGSKKNPIRFISVSDRAIIKAHKKHGDRVVADARCERERARR